jgi:hypothetical protein
LQQLYASLERLQEQNEVSRLFCDILTAAMPGKINVWNIKQACICTMGNSVLLRAVGQVFCLHAEARWQYLLLLYALIVPNAPAGLFALNDISTIVRKLYPQATDGEAHEMLQRYRESGLVRHLLFTSPSRFCKAISVFTSFSA